MRNDRLISRWKEIAPAVHDYFGLDAEARRVALEAARRYPHSALTTYRILAATIRPWPAAGARG